MIGLTYGGIKLTTTIESLPLLLDIGDLKIKKLEEDELFLKLIIEQNAEEVNFISTLTDAEISSIINNKFTNIIDIERKQLFDNLVYIKLNVLVEGPGGQVDQTEEPEIISNEQIGELKLKDILNLEELRARNGLEIKIDHVEALVREKLINDKWNEKNVVSTLSEKFNLTESKIKFISSLGEYINFVAGLDNPINFVSRGQKDCSYDLVPSLHRKFQKDHNMHAKRYESSFKQKMLYYEKDIRNRTKEELRAEGQHFGLPTIYLDFTEAHLVSLLFAIEDYNYVDKHSIVFFIDSASYNKAAINREEKLINFDTLSEVAALEEYSSRSFFIKLGNLNERIHFQKGCFLNISPAELRDNDEFNKRLSENCEVVIIDKLSKKLILSELFNLGITFENIYPDKDNLVKSINFYYEEILGGKL
jgi:hypothetical protein